MYVFVRPAFVQGAPRRLITSGSKILVSSKSKPRRWIETIKCGFTEGSSTQHAHIRKSDEYVTVMSHSGRIVRNVWRDAFMRTRSVIAIDATAGRGSDTLSLCELAGNDGVVHAVDVQAAALAETRARYDVACSTNVPMAVLRTHNASHDDLCAVTGLRGGVAAVVYNLGWYPAPGADRRIITRAESTLRSLHSATKIVSPEGIISIMAYVGHEGGRDEADSVREWSENLDRTCWSVVHLAYPNRRQAPELFLLQRAAA